ncbi:hypothetical protein [Streptomyces mirabilis]|uniref:hypothetical protein n=1 Tax=Streptomyces mirabilis TaxID=68239 RepID=UPI003679F7C0
MLREGHGHALTGTAAGGTDPPASRCPSGTARAPENRTRAKRAFACVAAGFLLAGGTAIGVAGTAAAAVPATTTMGITICTSLPAQAPLDAITFSRI